MSEPRVSEGDSPEQKKNSNPKYAGRSFKSRLSAGTGSTVESLRGCFLPLRDISLESNEDLPKNRQDSNTNVSFVERFTPEVEPCVHIHTSMMLEVWVLPLDLKTCGLFIEGITRALVGDEQSRVAAT